MKPQPRQAQGIVQDLEAVAKHLSQQLVGQTKNLQEAAGAPWGSQTLSLQEALARMDEFEDPGRAEELGKLSDGALAQAAIQAVKLREQGLSKGLWKPAPVAPPPAPGAQSLEAIISQTPELASLLRPDAPTSDPFAGQAIPAPPDPGPAGLPPPTALPPGA